MTEMETDVLEYLQNFRDNGELNIQQFLSSADYFNLTGRIIMACLTSQNRPHLLLTSQVRDLAQGLIENNVLIKSVPISLMAGIINPALASIVSRTYSNEPISESIFFSKESISLE